MSRFFFDTHDGRVFIADELGLEMDSMDAIKDEASRALRDMAGDKLPDGDRRDFLVSVRTEAGEIVLKAALSLVMEYGPAAQDLKP